MTNAYLIIDSRSDLFAAQAIMLNIVDHLKSELHEECKD